MKLIKLILITLLLIFIGYRMNIATPIEYQAGTVILKLKNHAKINVQQQMEFDNLAQKLGVEHIQKVAFNTSKISSQANDNSVYVLTFDKQQNVMDLCRQFEELPSIEYAEPNYPVTLFTQPNDSLYNNQYYLDQPRINAIFALPIHNRIRVGVVDSGIQSEHPELDSAMFSNPNETLNGEDDDNNGLVDDINGYNFFAYNQGLSYANPNDPIGHGTHIAGIIAARGNNSDGVSGLNNGAELINLSFLNSSGYGSQLDAARAIHYAIDMGAKVINCSWGYFVGSNVLESAIDRAESEGVIIVAAAGNSDSDVAQYPASFPSVISIGSINTSDQRSWFSSYGSQIDYVTYGEAIYNTVPNNSYNYKTGTSQATAIVTGIVSRILSYDNTLTREEVMAILDASCDDILNEGTDYYSGKGALNAEKIVEALHVSHDNDTFESIDEASPSPVINTSFTNGSSALTIQTIHNFPNPVTSDDTHFGIQVNQAPASVTIKVFNALGQQLKEIDQNILSTDYTSIEWNTTDENDALLPNGTYFYVAEVEKGAQHDKKLSKITILR